MSLRKSLLLATTMIAGLAAPAAASAQTDASPFTAATRYDALRRVVGTISADPDPGLGLGGSSGPLPFRAVRNTYDTQGRLVAVERGTLSAWQAETVAPASWSGFTVFERVDSTYDAMGRKLSETLSGHATPGSGTATVQSLTQYSYDPVTRVRCTAVRMNVAAFGSAPADACLPGAAGTQGPDRITRTTHDAADRPVRVETGVGTSERRDQALYGYTANGQLASLTDGNGNRSEMRYDGHDRLTRLVYPHPTLAGLVNEADYEGYTLDAAGNVTSRRLRDGQSIGQGYDALNRLTSRDLPATAWYNLDRSYIYDNLGRMTQASGNGTITRGYDALGRITAETTPWGTTAYRYDAAGRRSGMDHPAGGPTIGYSYTDTGETTAIREDPAGANVLLATYDYDALGRRTSLTRGNGTTTSYSYDPVSRLQGLGHDLLSAGSDFSASLIRNAAGQIASRTATDGAYAFTATAQSRTDTHNGLNQIAAAGAITIGHDANGNVSLIGTNGYSYTANNRLATVWNGVTYLEAIDDSMDRLHRYYDGSANRWLLYDDHNLIAESNPNAGTIARRYVHGPGQDEPLVWYEAGTRRWLHADERGSIVAVSDSSGQALAYHAYDEYGRPQGPAGLDTLHGRFGYTGQPWLPELRLFYYRARMYDPVVTVRFMQADPSGYEDGTNRYGYVGGDPVNRTDPTGLLRCERDSRCDTVHSAAAAAVARYRTAIAQLNGLRAAISAGTPLTSAQQGLQSAFERKFGENSASAAGIGAVVGRLESVVAAIGDRGSGALVQFGSFGGQNVGARANSDTGTMTIFRVGLSPNMTPSLSYQIGHEAGHLAGLRDLRHSETGMPSGFGRGLRNDRRAYGFEAANWLGRHQPSMAVRNNDNYHCVVWNDSTCGGSEPPQ